MRKILFFILILYSNKILSQNFNFGLKIGECITDKISNTWQSKNNNTFLGGLSSSYIIKKKYGIEIDLLYTSTNYKSSFMYSNPLGENLGYSNYKNYYLDIPIILKFNLYSSNKYPNIWISFGFQVNKLLYSNESDNLENLFNSYIYSQSKIYFENISYNIPFGLEIKYKFINIGYRYVIGKSDINYMYNKDFKSKENYDQIYVGFTLNK